MTNFQPKVPTDEQKKTMEMLRTCFSNLVDTIERDVSDGRCRSITFTKLEEASMWLNKAIVAG